LVAAVGLRDDYLLFSIGPSLDHLKSLGSGKRLVDRPEMKPLATQAEGRLQSVSFLSQAMNCQLNGNQQKFVDQFVETIDRTLTMAGPFMPMGGGDDPRERIRQDIQTLGGEVKGLFHPVGAITVVSRLNDRGIEDYQYEWGGDPGLDGSNWLSLLEHLGGKPVLGIVSRQKSSTKGYDVMVKVIKTFYGWFKDLALPNVPDPEWREKAENFLETAVPLVERLDKANRTMLFPALADGQTALVVDRKLTSLHFIEELPATKSPLPMAEPALVFGVSDAGLLKKAFTEYRESINGLLDAMRNIPGSEWPPEEVRIPEPEVKKISGGTLYSFPLPKEWGVDKQIVPNLGISDKVAVISASHAHTDRLLKVTPLSGCSLLSKTDRPRAAAAWFDWAILLEVASPWINMAAEQIVAEEHLDKTQKQAILSQVCTGVELLKVVRSISRESYTEGGAMVHHTLLEIRDIEK
jgi:hypothetical protein